MPRGPFEHESRTEQLSISVSEEAKEDLQELAELEETSVSKLLAPAIRRHREKLRRIKSKYGG